VDKNGVDVTSNAPVKTAYTFTNREWDQDAGMYYYRARYYDPGIGRFIQEDSDPGEKTIPNTLNTSYSYALNNPQLLVDPSGQFIFTLALAGSIAASFAVSGTTAVIATSGLVAFFSVLSAGEARHDFNNEAYRNSGEFSNDLGDAAMSGGFAMLGAFAATKFLKHTGIFKNFGAWKKTFSSAIVNSYSSISSTLGYYFNRSLTGRSNGNRNPFGDALEAGALSFGLSLFVGAAGYKGGTAGKIISISYGDTIQVFYTIGKPQEPTEQEIE
jgi:RHS repeat-associated protein